MVLLPSIPQDPQAAFGLGRYLDELLIFATQRIKTATNGTLITRPLLASTFSQPFDALVASNNRLAAHQSVHQVRLCIEVLRQYFTRNSRNTPAAAETSYRQAAYETLLRHLGTSYEEIRLARVADDATRAALADRLGIDATPFRPDNLDRLFFQPNQVTEGDLERLFGLVKTALDPNDPFRTLQVPELRAWQREHLWALWRQQDDAAQSVFGTPVPVIDPDLIGEHDLKTPEPGDAAYDLWKERQLQLASQLAAVKATRESQATPLAGFERIVSDTLGPVADLVALADEHKRGNEITPQLQTKQLTLPPFLHLMRMRDLVLAGVVSDAEWADVYDILVQVQKVRQYATWRQQEGTLILGPNHFTLPDATQPPTALPKRRATPQARQAWQETLRARLQQEQAVVQSLQAAVDATEVAVLPVLRDALVQDLVKPNDPTLDSLEKVANRLSQELAIDSKSSGSQRTTRLEQAIETVQGVLFASRMGRFKGTAVLGTNPAANWVLAPSADPTKTETHFDEEWQWIGAYATWRAAMFVFGYPENYLLPSLRPSATQAEVAERTAPFNALIKGLQGNVRLTALQARELAYAYLNPAQGTKPIDQLNTLVNEVNASLPVIERVKLDSFLLTDQRSESQLTQRGKDIKKLFEKKGFTNPHQAPNFLREICYFVPMALGLQLQKSGQYLAALDWFQTVYAHDLPVNERKIYHGLTLEATSVPPNFDRAGDWLRVGLNPHEIATKRSNAYTCFSLMSLVRCMLDFADAEFTRSTYESLPRARALYVTALELLRLPDIQPSPASPFPPNPVLQALQLHADMNLLKLRNGRNIAGLERLAGAQTLPDSTLGGLPTLNGSGQLTMPRATTLRPTPYRSAVLIERAKQLVTIAQQIEAAYLAALEKYDLEEYNLLRARQDLTLTSEGVLLQELRIEEAATGIALAQLQQQRSQIQSDHFHGLLDEGLIGLEQAAIGLLVGAAALHTAAAFIHGANSLVQTAKAIATFGFLGDPGMSAAAAASSLAAATSTTASVLETYASYERREEEWRFQRQLAEHDVLTGDQQVEIAKQHGEIVSKERFIAQKQSEFASDTLNFLTNKFTSAELYEWMSGVLGQVYSYFLQQATAMAQLAQSQLAFERQEPAPSFIQADYWETPSDTETGPGGNGQAPDRRGLTGSARLLQDISQLDQFAFETNKRKLQLAQTFSLAHMAPAEFQRFRDTGRLLFATPMELFDRDFPGHYLRLIKRVRTSVIALVPPTRGIRASLTASGLSRVVIGGDIFQTIVVRRDPELIAFTSSSNATGLLELEPQGEMLLPFESMGVDTTWELQMPKAANPFDYRTIADVVFTVEYTALHSFDYRQQVIKQLPDRVSAERPFSFRHQFADQWYDLHNPEQTATPMVVHFKTIRDDFPPNLEDLRIQQVLLAFVRGEGRSFEVANAQLLFTPDGEAVSVGGMSGSSIDGAISTRRGNASSWAPLLGRAPVGGWELTLPNAEEMKDRFKNEDIEDILFVITYAGHTPAWPA
jgi:hypothetical protein